MFPKSSCIVDILPRVRRSSWRAIFRFWILLRVVLSYGYSANVVGQHRHSVYCALPSKSPVLISINRLQLAYWTGYKCSGPLALIDTARQVYSADGPPVEDV